MIKSTILGGDSFEFGTTALMMLKCVMAKNCNVKCPAGLTTNPELYQGDPRALAQYFLNVAHEVREILATLGYQSLKAIRGKTDLLHLANHHSIVGRLDVTGLLNEVKEVRYSNPVYLEADFTPDNQVFNQLVEEYFNSSQSEIELGSIKLNNRNKSTGGQLSIDIERYLNYQNPELNHPAVFKAENGRRFLAPESIVLKTHGSAGQSYAAFNNTGLILQHTGTCNDGVGKGASGGHIVILNQSSHSEMSRKNAKGQNVLIGNFALFGATGGQVFIGGEAGDRFAVRNSGASAVTEGVGDFCCEYMTNGTIVNLGGYGKGFGNGMSGGMAFQYDVDGDFSEQCSQDSVLTLPLIEHDPGYEAALKWHLNEHVRFTDSDKAKALLADWQTSRTLFTLVVPLALVQNQFPEQILQSHSRKKMLEELIHGESNRLLDQVLLAFSKEQYLFSGEAPAYNETDSPLLYNILTQSGVLFRAKQLIPALETGQQLRRLFSVKDKKLLDVVSKDIKEALSKYNDDELAILLANKRIQDYKNALEKRDVWDCHLRATSVWLMVRQNEIDKQLVDIDSIAMRTATLYCHLFADKIREDIEQQIVA